MFKQAPGYKAQYHYLTLLVASDFDEWSVFLDGPDVKIRGMRQFSEAKAKDHARALAESYVREEKKEDLPVLQSLEWTPLSLGEWLNWR